VNWKASGWPDSELPLTERSASTLERSLTRAE
jgi:hypothetical protein